MAAHKRALPATKKAKRPAGWKETLRLARDLRIRADAVDPEHMDAAWAEEQAHTPRGHDPHAEMLGFYEAMLR